MEVIHCLYRKRKNARPKSTKYYSNSKSQKSANDYFCFSVLLVLTRNSENTITKTTPASRTQDLITPANLLNHKPTPGTSPPTKLSLNHPSLRIIRVGVAIHTNMHQRFTLQTNPRSAFGIRTMDVSYLLDDQSNSLGVNEFFAAVSGTVYSLIERCSGFSEF